MITFNSYLPDGYSPSGIKKVNPDITVLAASQLGMNIDTPANAVAKALSGVRWKCLSCKKQTKLISFNQGFREYCCTKCSNNAEDVIKKKQYVSLEKYGTLYPNQSEGTKLKIKSKLVDRISDTVENVEELIEKQGFKIKVRGETFSDEWTLHCECSHEFSLILPTWSRWNTGWKTICPACSRGSSSQEKELARMIEGLGFEILRRDRKLIAPLELDIFIPSKNLAVEFNGLYWHSDDKKRHLEKLEACKVAGIKLIQIFEHDWENKRDIVIARLKSALGLNMKIHARKTEVVEIKSSVAREFFEDNHLHGSARKGKYYYGLKYEDRIVQVISICKSRFSKLATLELLRSATVRGMTVVGGLSKLIRHALKVLGLPIMTYADRCWGEGLSYEKAGGKFIANTPPGFIWWKGNKTINRFYAWRCSIKKIIGDAYNEDLSTEKNMRNAGWRQLWNAGNTVYLLS